MDYLHVIENKDLLEYTENLNYKTAFVADKYFPKSKSRSLSAFIRQLVEGGDLPVMAQFHALDAESRIGDRTNYTELKFEKLPIKEKLNVSERILEAFGEGVSDSLKGEVLRYIFNDSANLVTRILTREACANAEVIATGKLTIKENGIDTVVDYNIPEANKISISDWNDPDHDIVADLEAVRDAAKAKGYKITGAMCNSKVIGYIVKNAALRKIIIDARSLPTENNVLRLLTDAIGYGFDVNDDVYVTAVGGATKQMFPDDVISFFTAPIERVGVGALGYTPEELAGINSSERSQVTLTTYHTEDPVALWTKASALYIPILRNPNGLFIATISNTEVSY